MAGNAPCLKNSADFRFIHGSSNLDRCRETLVDPLPDRVNLRIGQFVLAGRHLARDYLIDDETLIRHTGCYDGAGSAALERGIGSAKIQLAHSCRAMAGQALGVKDRLHRIVKRGRYRCCEG